MTPLAWELLEDLFDRNVGISIRRTPYGDMNDARARTRTFRMLNGFLREAKFFELTAVWPMAGDLGRKMWEEYEDHDRVDQRRAYLPAPITWLEVEMPSLKGIVDDEKRLDLINGCVLLDANDLKNSTHNYRAAWVLVGRGAHGSVGDSTHIADCYQIQYETPRLSGPRVWRIMMNDHPLPLVQSGMKPERSRTHRNSDGQWKTFDHPMPYQQDFIHYAMLALINSPGIIGQRGHYPFGYAERQILKKAKLIGNFPLRAWTEILLQVTPNPENRSNSASKEMHLTGERCLHYCRTYLRVRLGLLEYVEGHWRGNPALGIRQSRYRVKC